MHFTELNDSELEAIPVSSKMKLFDGFDELEESNITVWDWAHELLRNKSQQSPDDPALAMLKHGLRRMRVYYTPSVIVFGVIGNSIVWITLLCSKLRKLSCSHYLAAAVIVNTLHLLALLVQWLTLFEIDLYNAPGFCQFVSFINSLSVFLSIWYVVCFSVDRYIACIFPGHTPIMCTTLRAKTVVIGLSLVGFVIYMNISLTVGVINLRGKPRCSPLPMFLHNLRILTVFDMVINIIIPYTTILYMDIVLIRNHLASSSKTEKAFFPRSQSLDDIPTGSNNNDSGSDSSNTGWHTERVQTHVSFADEMHVSLRKFAIVFLTFFLLTHMPSEMFRLVHTAKGLLNKEYSSTKWEYYLQMISQHIFNTSLASHLWLYVLFHAYFSDGIVRSILRCSQALRLSHKGMKSTSHELQVDAQVQTSNQNDSFSSSVCVTFV